MIEVSLPNDSVGFSSKPAAFDTDFPQTLELGTITDIGVV